MLTCDLVGELDRGVQGVQKDSVGLVSWFEVGAGCWKGGHRSGGGGGEGWSRRPG